MAFTLSTSNPPVRGTVVGQHFVDIFPQVAAGASGNVLKLGASRVISVDVSGTGGADVTWSYAKPTLTIAGLTDTNHYDIRVTYI